MAGTKNWYRVSAPYITCKTQTTEGARIIGLHHGAPLPPDVPQASLDHLFSHNLVEQYPLSDDEWTALKQIRPALAAGDEAAKQREADAAAKAEAAKVSDQAGTSAAQAGSDDAAKPPARPGGAGGARK